MNIFEQLLEGWPITAPWTLQKSRHFFYFGIMELAVDKPAQEIIKNTTKRDENKLKEKK